MAAAEGPIYLYHEKQVAALCGQHCLNTLLQGPYFSEIDLAQIAQELDALEQSFMAESGMDSSAYKLWQQEASGNVAADGMFSIQVLSKALTNWDLTCTNLDSPEAAASSQHPELEQAFICNLQEHWLTVRKVAGSWYNFNSLYSAPEFLGTLYLTTFLATLKEQGYSNFVVQGKLPQCHPDAGSNDSPGCWFTPEEAQQVTKDAVKAREVGYLKAATSNILEKATEKGTMVTLRAPSQAGGTGKRERDWNPVDLTDEQDADPDHDLAWAIAASLQGAEGTGASPSEEWQSEAGPSRGDSEDILLASAIAASLADSPQQNGTIATESESGERSIPQDPDPEPLAGPGIYTLAMRLPNGARLVRRFESSQTVSQVLDFIRHKGIETTGFDLTAFPAKVFAETNKSLETAGIRDKDVLMLRKKVGQLSS